MENTTDLNALAVYMPKHNTIGIIINAGFDGLNYWYRTDAEGIRERHEFIVLHTIAHLKHYLANGAQIAPSTAKILGIVPSSNACEYVLKGMDATEEPSYQSLVSQALARYPETNKESLDAELSLYI